MGKSLDKKYENIILKFTSTLRNKTHQQQAQSILTKLALQYDFLTMAPSDLNEFISWYTDTKNNKGEDRKPYDIRNACCTLSSFFRFLLTNDYRKDNPAINSIQIPKSFDPLPYHRLPTVQEIDSFLKAAKEQDIQLYVISSMAAMCGLTESEIHALKRQNFSVNPETDSVYLQCGDPSRKSFRNIELPDTFKNELLHLLATTPADQDNIFFTSRNKPMALRTMQYYVQQLSNQLLSNHVIFHKISLRSLTLFWKYLAAHFSTSISQVAKYTGTSEWSVARIRQAADRGIIHIPEGLSTLFAGSAASEDSVTVSEKTRDSAIQ